jgi:hypothetical protein
MVVYVRDVSGRAVKGVGIPPLACRDYGLEYRWGHGYLCLVSVVCCQIQVSGSGWSLIQRSPTECGVSECDREATIKRKTWPTGDCCAMGDTNIESVMNKMSVVYWWNDQLKLWKRNFFHCHAVHHKYHTSCPGTETWLSRWDADHQSADLWPDPEGYQNICFTNSNFPCDCLVVRFNTHGQSRDCECL